VSGRLASDPGSPDVDATHAANRELFCDPERWRNWARITPFFNYPLDIRKVLLDIGLPTLNRIEAARQIRKLAPVPK
jgi:CheY-like chemotaxis protein